MKASELLTIDTESELRKLAEGTLEGPWQVPTELVRRAIAAGARRVQVQVERSRVVVHDDGHPLSPERQRALARLLDPTRPPSERHESLLALEAEPELLSIAALHPKRTIVHADEVGTTITLLGAPLDTAAARRWLRSCARFAAATIVVDGVRVAGGFEGALVQRPLEAPLAGRIAVTTDETAHLWLLGGGVVSSHLTLPDTPGFEAAVELPRGAPSSLREAVEPHLAGLVDQAVRLLLDLAARPDLHPDQHRSLRSRLLVSARRGWRRAELFHAPLFPAVEADGGWSRLSLSELGGGRPVPCLDPGEDVDDFLLPATPVIVIDAEERGRLSQLLSVRFHPVERRQTRLGLGARTRRALLKMKTAAAHVASRVRHPGGLRPLPDSMLSAEERAFLRALRASLPPAGPRVELAEGGGPPRRGRAGWVLPRRAADVRGAIRLVGRDPSSAYLALLALCDDAVPLPGARDGWRARTMESTHG